MEKLYTIFAAISDETNEGWIWLSDPPLPPRTVVRVYDPVSGRVVFCETRSIDDNFRRQYNKREQTKKIDNSLEALVVSEWYRNALGGFATTAKSNNQVKLNITPAGMPGWRSLRASCNHPDLAVRVGTRLGVLGAWLGLVGLIPPLFDIARIQGVCRVQYLIAVAVVGAIIGILACRGVRRPTS
jgi:hypothetical protein